MTYSLNQQMCAIGTLLMQAQATTACSLVKMSNLAAFAFQFDRHRFAILAFGVLPAGDMLQQKH